MVVAGLEGELGTNVFGEVTRVINVLADHVADVERAVGAHGGVDGAEPLVRCGEKIATGRGVCGGEGGAGVGEHLALHEVLCGFANEGAGAANTNAAGTSVGAGVLLAKELRDVARSSGVGAQGIHLGGNRNDVLYSISKGIVRITP